MPLSWPQLGILQETRGRGDPRLYQLSFVLESGEAFDHGALAASVHALSGLHPLLGARLVDESTAPAWRLGAAIPPPFLLDAAPASLRSWLAEPLDLEGPLFAVALCPREGGGSRLAVSWNHLVADGWSFGLIWRDFLRLYRSALEGKPAEGSIPARSYADFSAWSLSYPRSLDGLADLEYWRSALSYRPPFGGLPLRAPWPPLPGDPPAAAREIPFAIELPGGLPRGRSLFEHCLSAWLIVLARLSGREDPLVALPCLGRPGREYLGTVGHCSNLIHLSVETGGAATYGDLLSLVADRLARAKAHQLYPSALLATELGGSGRWPLTEAYCSLVSAPPSAARDFGLGAIRQAGSPWAIAFEVQKAGDRARGVMRVPEGLWDEAILDMTVRGLSRLIAAASAEPGLPLSACFPLTDAESAAIESLRSKREGAEDRRRGAMERRMASHPDGSKGCAKTAVPMSQPSDPALRTAWIIMRDVLGRDDIGLEDDFFLLGGTSLSALRMASRLSSETGLSLPSTLVFHARSLEAIGERLRAALAAERAQGPAAKPGEAPRAADGRASARSVVEEERRRSNREGRILASSQARMWYLWRLAPDDPAYHLHACLHLHGPLDPDALGTAFRLLQLRHEALRSVFPPGPDGLGRQVVRSQAEIPMSWEDLRNLPPPAALARAREIASANARAGFDLDRSPPLRFLLAALPGKEWVVSFALHHIIADQWSWGILSREISELYASVREGREPRLPPILSDQSAAEREAAYLASRAAEQDEAFWRSELSGLAPLDLPPDRLGKEKGEAAGLRLALSGEAAARAEAAAATAGVAPSLPYLAALALALWRRTGKRDFALAMPSANRDDADLEGVVGTFVNTLVVRVRVDPLSRAGDFLSSLGSAFLSAQEHRKYPYERAIRLGARDGEAASPEVLFNVVNAPMALPSFSGLLVEPLGLPPGALQFPLSLVVDPALERTAAFLWDGAKYHEEGMRLLAASWLASLEALCSTDRRIAELPLSDLPLDAPDPEALRDRVARGPSRTFPRRGMAEILWEEARDRLDRPAILRGTEAALSYGDLFGMAASISRRLRESGVGRGDVVAVHLDRGPTLLASLLAIWARGAAYLPIDPAYPRARKRHMVIHSRARLALVMPGAADPFGAQAPGRGEAIAADGTEALPPTLAMDDPPAGRLPFDPLPVNGEETAYLLYTSGSTGLPKGVSVPHRALSNFLHSMLAEPGFPEGERLLSVTSPSFDISGLEYWLPLLAGGSLRIASAEEARDPGALTSMMSEDGIGFLQATPSSWRLLLESGWQGRLRTALCGGEAFPPDLVQPLLDRCDAVWNMYGPTETTIWSSLQRIERDDWPLSVGRPIANTELRVLDEALRPLPPLCPGDIWISGEGLASGYHRAPDLTEASFRPIPNGNGDLMYRSGDRGRFLPDGRLVCMGRADEQVKLNGHRIELGEIEAVLSSFAGVKRAVCDLRSDGPGRDWIGAWLVMEGDRGLPPASELEAHILSRLPSYMLPAAWGLAASVPLGPSGKVDRRALPPLRPASGAPVPPADSLEEGILHAWESVLGASGFGVERDFFSLGGHSLLALRLVSAIAKATGKELSLKDFFAAPTVRGNARSLRGAPRWTAETEILYTMHAEGRLRPLFLVAGVYADEDGLYRHLAAMVAHIGADRPVYLLRPRGIAGSGAPYASAREAGQEFAAAIRSVQGDGPYLIAGECVGGIHAYETARILHAGGQRVGALILMDSEYPRPASDRAIESLAGFIRSARYRIRSLIGFLGSGPGALLRMAKGLRGYLCWKRRELLPLTRKERARVRFDRVQGRYEWLSRVYPMPPYPGRVELLVNEADHAARPALGWLDASGKPRRGPDEVKLTILPGDHRTRLADYGGETGAAIRAILDRAEAKARNQ